MFRLLLFIYLETHNLALEMLYSCNSECDLFLILFRACLMYVFINLGDSLHMMFIYDFEHVSFFRRHMEETC